MGCFVLIIVLILSFCLGGAVIYFLYNILLAMAFPQLPLLTFFQCCIIGLILGILRGNGGK